MPGQAVNRWECRLYWCQLVVAAETTKSSGIGFLLYFLFRLPKMKVEANCSRRANLEFAGQPYNGVVNGLTAEF